MPRCKYQGSVRKLHVGNMAKGGTTGFLKPLKQVNTVEIRFSTPLKLKVNDWVEYEMHKGTPKIMRRITDKRGYQVKKC